MELLETSGTVKRAKPMNIKKEFGKYLRKWPWILLSMAVFYTVAKIYLRYAQPQYYTKTSLKLQESNGKATSALNDLKYLGMGVSGSDELQGETQVIVSKPILQKVAKNLNLDVSFFSSGAIKEFELYNDAPYIGKIISIDNPTGFSGATYTITPVGNNTYKLSNSSKTYTFGVPAQVSFGVIQIDAKPGTKNKVPLKVVFKNISSVVGYLEGSITVTLPPNKGMMMEVSMVGPVPKKSEDILNEVSKQYLIDGVNDKNEEAQSTQNFINDRIAIITEDLSGIEGQKENFKRANEITNLDAQASQAISESSENTKAVITQSMQLDLVNSVLAAANGDQLMPSGMGLSAGAESSITQYNELLLTRNRTLKQATGENPAVIEMNKQLGALKNLIRKILLESRETLQLQIAQANAQLNLAKGKIRKYPTQEKIFRSIDRQQTLKEQLYLYLLQKREENAITLAVNIPKAKIVNPAYTTGQVKPETQNIILGALAAGFLLPLVFFYGANALDTKVHTKDHIIDHAPDTSVLAEIPENHDELPLIGRNDLSVFAESFRILASNLKFLLRSKESEEGGVVLVTSSVKGEGKTTVSVNIALTLSGNSKTIIVGADIRNPQLDLFFQGKNVGLTDYLISRETVPDSYIVSSGQHENLDVLFSGQIAPNPNDLLDMVKFDQLIDYLKTKYEFIILDSAPVMLVSDTLHLIENSDVVLYVAKSNFTEKEMIDFAAGFRQDNKIKNMAFVLNGVLPQDTRYGTRAGYGYYSYTHDTKPKWWKRILG